MTALRILLQRVTGFLLLVLAAYGIAHALRCIRLLDWSIESFFRLLLTGVFILVMTGLALYFLTLAGLIISFSWQARRKVGKS
jgi:hypothetical protein